MTTEELVIADAISWWERHRPVSFTEEQHLANPDINTSTYAEHCLCLSVAAYIKKRDAK